jgi:DNA repair exonuclease SbcCD nuclease subunit
MNNILLFSDLHICQSSLKECISVLEEIGMLANKYNVDTLINLGDTFDNTKPTSQELDVFATFIRRLNKQMIIIAADSHESETQTNSIINHFGILNEMVTVIKEFKDSNHLYCGHYVIKESKAGYGAKLSKIDFKDYLYVFLGHQHSYEVIKPNICHLGSVRYVDFAEAQDKVKIVTLITGYGTDKEEVHFLKLKSPIPMIELKLQKKDEKSLNLEISNVARTVDKAKESGILGVKQGILKLQAALDQFNPKTKVKIKILDFESYREFLPFVNKYSAKFEVFKYATEFEVVSDNTQKGVKTEIATFKESLTNYLKNQKIDPKITEILQKEIE